MSTLRTIARKLPLASRLYRRVQDSYRAARRERMDPEAIFTDIFQNNDWAGGDSVSGQGSDLEQTRVVVELLPELLRELSVTRFLDLPCGDFHWMSRVDLTGVDYLGGDIVKDLVAKNARHQRAKVRFQHLDLLAGELPAVDLALCRDCLVHFSDEDVFRALRNLARSGSRYLLTTTFPDRAQNPPISTGKWRPLNLQAAPFSLPAPERLVNERCTEGGGAFADKSLGLWRLEAIASALG